MAKPAPRLTGRPLRLLGRMLRSTTLGPPLRRAMSAMVVDSKLAAIDFAAAGEPAPFCQPPAPRTLALPSSGGKGADGSR
jgi:hypothetical protein